MKVRRVALAEAAGMLLAHNAMAGGRRVLRKGVALDAAAVQTLAAAGIDTVYAAELEPGDVGEDAAADRLAAALVDTRGLEASAAATGRVTIRARRLGVVRVDVERLAALNAIAGVTLATVERDVPAGQGDAIATLKIIPFALGGAVIARAEALGPILALDPIEPRRVSLIVWGAPSGRDALFEPYRRALALRLEALGQRELRAEYVAVDRDPEAELAAALEAACATSDVVIVVGETAIIDIDDLVPAAVRQSGGEVAWLGAPVFPGNLLLVARRGDCAIIGAPSCARSPAPNVVDAVVPRVLAGERLDGRAIAALGLGGMLTGHVRRPPPGEAGP